MSSVGIKTINHPPAWYDQGPAGSNFHSARFFSDKAAKGDILQSKPGLLLLEQEEDHSWVFLCCRVYIDETREEVSRWMIRLSS